MIERHITLDRSMWGSDHAASLEPNGFTSLVGYVRLVEKSMGDGVKQLVRREQPVREKLRAAKFMPHPSAQNGVSATAGPQARGSEVPRAHSALVLDLDGVFTDGSVWWGPTTAGGCHVRPQRRFAIGPLLARRAGLVVALISGEDSPIDRFGWPKLQDALATWTRQGQGIALRALAERHGFAGRSLFYRR